MRRGERGYVLVLVLIVLAVGSVGLLPVLDLVSTGLKSTTIQSDRILAQYTRDAGGEFVVWQLLSGGATSQLAADGDEVFYTVTLNGLETQVVLRLNGAATGLSTVPGAKKNRIRPSVTVECDVNGDGVYGDDCLALPTTTGMVARYTVYMEQIGPDANVGVTALYNELPRDFDFIAGTVASPDGSLLEIESVTPVNIGSSLNEIWKWVFSAPLMFGQGEVKAFTFEAFINSSNKRYCDRVLLKLEKNPSENSGATAPVVVGSGTPEGCAGGGLQVSKSVDTSIVQPGADTIVTYEITVENFDQLPLQLHEMKDFLPPDFTYCSPAVPPPAGLSCDPPMYRFTDETSFTEVAAANVEAEYKIEKDRWEVEIEGGWNLAAGGASGSGIVFRFQAVAAPDASGTYYNEAFAKVEGGCVAPQPLVLDGVTSSEKYCSAYSWPTAGVLVPSYDVQSTTGGVTSQGNIILLAAASASIDSWHVN